MNAIDACIRSLEPSDAGQVALDLQALHDVVGLLLDAVDKGPHKAWCCVAGCVVRLGLTEGPDYTVSSAAVERLLGKLRAMAATAEERSLRRYRDAIRAVPAARLQGDAA